MKIILNKTLIEKGRSQYWLSQTTGIASSTINNLCNGKTSGIQFDVLQKICTALNCSVNNVIESEDLNIPIYPINKSDTSE